MEYTDARKAIINTVAKMVEELKAYQARENANKSFIEIRWKLIRELSAGIEMIDLAVEEAEAAADERARAAYDAGRRAVARINRISEGTPPAHYHPDEKEGFRRMSLNKAKDDFPNLF